MNTSEFAHLPSLRRADSGGRDRISSAPPASCRAPSRRRVDETVSMAPGQSPARREPDGIPLRIRRLPAAWIARARRHGHGLRSRTDRHRAPRRPEDARAAARFAGDASAVSPRRPPCRGRQPSEQPLHFRVRGDRRRPGDHDGDRRQRHAQGQAQETRPAPGDGGGRRDPRRHRRPGSRLRGRGAAPRHQAVQLFRQPGRFGEGRRLRPVGVHAGEGRLLCHGHRRHHGHPGLRVAGTASRR